MQQQLQAEQLQQQLQEQQQQAAERLQAVEEVCLLFVLQDSVPRRNPCSHYITICTPSDRRSEPLIEVVLTCPRRASLEMTDYGCTYLPRPQSWLADVSMNEAMDEAMNE